ncbi:hypothetical protein NLJ89_g11551 [Agrocybe chaxingu]|uniref:Polyprotein n=1 Tax=Agrocybe chaxingu TaxID=84603 RepID=A0A9W8JNZ7_9AGAR|nr:hypothetical protein NLJ89_g11551 [Agrocybe chaxingu]
MSTKEDFLKVPKLLADGSNWVTYKDRLRWAVDARGLLNHLDEDIPEPTKLTVTSLDTLGDPNTPAKAGTTSTTDERVTRGYELRTTQYKTSEATVKQAIASTIPDSVFNRIKTKKTAKNVWDALTEIFENRSLTVAIDLRHQMQTIKCGKHEDVRTHFAKLANMNERLSSMGITFSDHEYATILIGSLPRIYDPTISSILAAAKLSKKPLDPDTVTSLIQDDFDRRDVSKEKSNKDSEKDASFYAGSDAGRKGPPKGGRQSITCHNCSKRGHVKADCWAKGGGKEGQGRKGRKGGRSKTSVASVAVATAEADDDGVWAVADDEEFNDWRKDDDEGRDLRLLDDSIPAPSSANMDLLRYILLGREEEPDTNDEEASSMPSLTDASTTDDELFVDYSDAESSVPSLDSMSSFVLMEEEVDRGAEETEEEVSEGTTEEEEDERGNFIIDQPTDTGAEPYTSFAGAVIEASDVPKPQCELYDSGASRHMTPFRDRLINYIPIDARPITAADKRIFHAVGKGDLRIQIPNGKTTTVILLRDVLYAPSMGLTIVSISRIAAAGCAALFRSNFCRIFDSKDRRIGHIHISPNGLYRVEHGEVASSASTTTMTVEDLHQRMGHISHDAARKLVKQGLVTGVVLEGDDGRLRTCESCEYAKATRKRIRKEREEPRAESFGDEIHSDLWGPARTETIRKKQYYVSFTDDATRYTSIALLRHKDEAFDAYREFEAWAEMQHNAKIKRLRSDRGGEYTSDEFDAHLKAKGTERRLTTHDTPEHNGVAEALNRRLLEKVRAMLHESGLPRFLWGDAIMHAVWLKNRTSTRALDNMTPYEALTGKKPDLANLPEWGCKVWVHDAGNGKLEGRSKVGQWVGFDQDSTHAHRIYFPEKRLVSIERNVKFSFDEVLIPATVDVPLEGESNGESDLGKEGINQQADSHL